MQNVELRRLERSEVETVWQIERRELVHEVYRFTDGVLQLHQEFYDTQDWPEGEPELYTPILLDCYDHGGLFIGAYAGKQLIAAVVVDARPVGDYPHYRQLAFLHVSHNWRGQGLASRLYCYAMELTKAQGVAGFYISSTSTKHTVDFYMHQGGKPVVHADKALYTLEPDDIHLLHTFSDAE